MKKMLEVCDPSNDEDILEVRNLSVRSQREPDEDLVRSVTLSVGRGEIVGVVGESGSGKTLTSLAIAQLLPTGLHATADTLRFAGHDLRGTLSPKERTVLGTQMAMVFQDPLSSLNPARRIGSQMTEAVRRHRGFTRSGARELAAGSLEAVGIDSPSKRLRQYPHELSGGMRQRVMIAMGLMSEPSLFVADEPTTALDVTVQAQVVELLCQLNELHGSAVLFISHNIALLSEVCDRLIVMFRGDVVETLTVEKLLAGAEHPYTRALVGAIPDLNTDRAMPLLTVGESLHSGRSEGLSNA